MNNESLPNGDTRQERREAKLRKKKARIKQHGKSIIKVYAEAVLKRLKGKKK